MRDELGHAAMAGAGSLETVCDAQTAESHACLAALQAAADQGLQNVILETDSQILVKALQSDMYGRARGGMLFREAKFTMAINFNSVVVVHAPRSYNRVAHELARLGRGRDPDHPAVWMHPLPDFVTMVLLRDITDPEVN